MPEISLSDIKWTAAFVGFGVDLVFSLFVGSVVVGAMLALKGVNLAAESPLPSDVNIAYQLVGVVGALVGGSVAGFLAGNLGSLHGLLASSIGLVVFFCASAALGSEAPNLADLGFIVLNLVAASYGGALGERFRARRKGAS
jgi:hypothetical protein